ncbi:MAG: rhodanese-related sulfurtransferase [Bacteroidetes bacterium]|uniref:oxygen-dependent tRNA uridine(34) hydroxylase TrhO n=1 Tax=Phnomibacter sp. TaxID=2836217 RepID=UPI002FDD160C|nr:rhodanese-related sulfurtransferase [Bacteroidota bacterium]
MALLHNRVSNKELKERLMQETEPRTTISFYMYHPIANPQAFRDELWKGLHALKVFGRIYVAHEGINAQISVPSSNFDALRQYLYSYEWMNGMRLNIAVEDDGKSFWVLRIKVRDKIVADGIDDPNFSMERKGKYLKAKEVNELMQNPDVLVIDMRNHYEYEVGHFDNAIEIPSDTFREQLPMAVDMMKGREDKPVIMYCTGGIRCEKASAYMLHRGFKNVFHIEGGIINYVHQVKEQGLEQKFIGKNFVFDNRLGERVTEDVIAKCHQCGQPADTHTNCANDACHLLFIQCDACKATYEGCCSTACQEVIHLPEEAQKELRKGKDNGAHIFSKSRERLRPRLDGR